jgi:Xaa-Pro aminopeptidase
MTGMSSFTDKPTLAPKLQSLLGQEIPRFSGVEMQRRRRAIEQAMARKGVDHLLIYGADRSGGGVQWLTGWPVTTEAAAVVTPGRRDAMYIHYFNHIPLARQIAMDADVDWGGAGKAIEPAIAELKRRGAKLNRVGIVGPLGYAAHAALSAAFGTVADLNADYIRMRMIKSDEELDWLRIGAYFSDLAIGALRAQLKPGLSEFELGDIVERAYMTLGGTSRIHYMGVTPMSDPDCCVPKQYPSARKVQSGDVFFTEISANFWEYSGQVLRTFAVDAEPTPLYRELHAVAEEVFASVAAVIRPGATPQDVVAAAGAIEKAGFTTCDDLVHGYGGGYLPPVLGSQSRPAGPLPKFAFEAGMTVVVQPNIITRDQRAGVQLGELLRITDTGVESLHQVPREFFRV